MFEFVLSLSLSLFEKVENDDGTLNVETELPYLVWFMTYLQHKFLHVTLLRMQKFLKITKNLD